MNLAVSIEKLHKTYQGKNVLKGISLDIEEGQTLVILGRSGSGKSVLLRHIIGLETPDAGKIWIKGVEITNLERDQKEPILKTMGMLFQSAALFDSLSIEENIGFYLKHHIDPQEERFLTAQEIKLRVEESLHAVGLDNVNKLMPSDLSGGMKKRAALARIIAYRPSIWLYDEPTTGLDPITAMQINALIVSTQKKLHNTSIVVTHDLCSTLHIADKIAFIKDGMIQYVADKDTFLKIPDETVQYFLRNAIPEGLGSLS